MARDPMLELIGDHLVLDIRHPLTLPQEFLRDTTARYELEQYFRSDACRPMLKLAGDYLVLDGRHYLLLPPEYRLETTARHALRQYLRSIEKVTAMSYYSAEDSHD